ncbi:YhdP family protein [Rhizobium terrae]|uniref:YhdP family protein n=1 Tax=Rhizobium terrae TaxID=2171756 RepID=UPI000E3CB725|nr:AsmA-like C-terminal domain-containing protein [Rhizobium terrae]
MAEIRGERVSFNRKEIVPLHELPSAQVEDPVIVHCPPPRSRMRRLGKTVVLFLMLVILAAGSAVFAIETGIVDGTLSARAQSALNDAIGPRYKASLGSTAIRFDSGFRLALEARDVDVIEQATGEHLSRTGAMRMAVDPLALLSGRISIKHMEAEDIRLYTAQLPSGDPMPLSEVRVDAMPAVLEQAFQRLDEAKGLIERTGTGSVSISGIEVLLPAAPGRKPISLVVDDLELARSAEGEVEINGEIRLNDRKATLVVASKAVDGVTTSLSATLTGLEMTPFLLQRTDGGQPREGIEGTLDLELAAVRSRETTKPSITAKLRQSPGRFYFDGLEQTFTGADINIAYDFAKNSVELLKSEARFGPTILPFTGAVIDLNRLNPDDKRIGFGLDLLISGGTAVGATASEQPARFDLKANGRYLAADRELQFDEMGVSSPLGRMAGALKVRFGDQSPEISFGAQLPHMQVTGVKQLWPFWMARKPREWVMDNMFGGTVTNGSIAVFIPAGRMKGPGIPMELNRNELQISFDMADVRINLPGDVPPLRDIDGRFDLKGEAMQVDVARAASFFPSGRFVAVEGGRFSIPSTYAKPLMADLALNLAGPADAVTELSNFRPINALKGTGFKPEDFSGHARIDLKARMGLINAHNPPKPTWNAHIDLDKVNLAPQFSGHRIGALDGTLDIDTKAARLVAKGTIDDVPADLMVVEPVDNASPVKRERIIRTVLNNDQREKLAPGLSDMIDGTVTAQLTRIDETRQAVSLDLGRATLSVPWVGWTKGGGIPAKAQFELSGEGEHTEIRNFELSGDGFGAKGALALNGGSLNSADFSHMQLSPSDNYAVSVKRAKGNFDVSITGSVVDLRPVITKLRAGGKGGGKPGGDDNGNATVRARIDRMIGFNDQALSNVSLLFSSRGGDIATADFSGVTESGQAVVSQMTGGDTISITSGDAGAFIRFMNLYGNMRGGLLNLRLKEQGDAWAGSVDLRSFSLVNEQKLESLVSTADQEGRSLNTATRRNIDVTSAKFQRGFASLLYRNGALAIENGVVRGEQIGATFQGLVRDAKGNMDMTGTFMPAYGLNRLFGELPLIGEILGNGRDRGLVGITFKLEGQFDKPKLTVNPLSLIAPGIFRQIFEFQ